MNTKELIIKSLNDKHIKYALSDNYLDIVVSDLIHRFKLSNNDIKQLEYSYDKNGKIYKGFKTNIKNTISIQKLLGIEIY